MKYGVPYLFLYPEYLGNVGFWSHAILGFSVGGFIMAFNIYTYIIHAYRFPFLATLSKPFYKFCLNNSVIPVLFILTYLWCTIEFQNASEFESVGNIVLHVLGFLGGLFIFFFLSFFYFFRTNKDFSKFMTEKEGAEEADRKTIRPRKRWTNSDSPVKQWRVETYLKDLSSISLARGAEHYDEETMRKVFYQNHINASVFEILLVVAFFIISAFDDVALFVIPAGASVLLVFTLLLMLVSIFLSWIRGWTLTLLIVALLVVNQFSSEYAFLPGRNELYGLDYKTAQADYSRDNIHIDGIDKSVEKDRLQMMQILDKWKEANTDPIRPDLKPKMLLINASGGGLRSSLWTVHSLCRLDSLLGGQLMEKTALMSGASGGMLGLSFLRDRYLDKKRPLYSDSGFMKERISRDLLNPVLFSIASSDIFFRIDRIEYNGHLYDTDRAYKFEQQLIANLDGATDYPLGHYTKPEAEAEIPMMILSPTIINDGRRMLVSSQPIAHLCNYAPGMGVQQNQETENVEFTRLFAEQGAMNARYTSLLRASATFPYIFPQVTLPSSPTVNLMDAGIRDNFGFKTSYAFIYSMKEWIEENTSGIVIVQVRDQGKKIRDKEVEESLMTRLTSPVGNVYGNFTKTHDFTHDQMTQLMSAWLSVPMEEVNLQLENDQSNVVSMSWHLTSLEKATIDRAIDRAENKEALSRLVRLLE